MKGILQHLSELSGITRIKTSAAKHKACAITGCTPSFRAAVLAATCEELNRPALVVCPSEGEAEKFAADLRQFTDGVFVLPARELILTASGVSSHEYEREALGVLDAARCKKVKAVIGTAEAFTRYTVSPEVLAGRLIELKTGMTIAPNDLVQSLLKAGYVRVDPVEAKGQFCLRGGIADVYPSNSENPLRIEFFGDEIERMAFFDADSQRRTSKADKMHIVPAGEIFPDDPEQFQKDLGHFCTGLHTKNAGDYRSKAESDLTALREGRRINFDRYYNLVHKKPATIFDYLQNPVCAVFDFARTAEAGNGFEKRWLGELSAALEEGFCAKGVDEFYESLDVLFSRVTGSGGLFFDNFAKTALSSRVQDIVTFDCRVNAVWNGSPDTLHEWLSDVSAGNFTPVILVPTKRAAKALIDDLTNSGKPCVLYGLDEPFTGNTAHIAVGALSGGFELPELKFSLLTSTPPRAVKTTVKRANAIGSISELKPGCYVVHQAHGIGLYNGVETITAAGATKDYLKISYSGTDVLYLPVTQLDMLSKYIGPDDNGQVKLNKLGSAEWQRTRSKVKAAVRDMADELIALYSKRKSIQGHAFSSDTPWQEEFEQRFEYDETADQLRCVEEIKADMEQPVPMDRLLCGDVGFGKTEVALRAVFKCVMDGKQAAILAPTTILAWQHYETLCRRMSGFGIEMGLLSRFVTPKQASSTKSKLRTGGIDVVVGTHSILQKDIAFKDLGLIVVDEEQRFGVSQKETLKTKFPVVDVLTLSATPIPRTMNMAISGIRDMSMIDEAPIDRHPVRTFVAEYDLHMLADAIRREQRRGGQVFWLHNRIEDISYVAAKLQTLIPEVRIVCAHGQMDKEELSGIWRRMMDGEIDVLVCTTIIESGIDLPNVNTLIIENADKMGLSQLHQIRGRVGRSSRRAYAYLTYRPEKALSEIAQKRLEAINEFTEFGAGYAIAVRDMEIRGAGDLLGARQHGHMASVGYDMYLKLLAEAVAEAKGEKPQVQNSPCLIDLPIDAFIPPAYIKEPGQRLDIYRKIAAAGNKNAESEVLAELRDRFGEPPVQVSRLLEVARLRNRATACGVTELSKRGDGLVFYMNNPERSCLPEMTKKLRGRVMMNANGARPHVYVKLLKDDPAVLAARVLEFLSGSKIDSAM
ncbi:MAG TPA: transcription-repair coupling factor [Oscillospiraceae bacterium]|nr:transcription-repair coupling factor [Oscillospiraceae bacterium]HPS33772.1 transcription-repair coupling factor [Oscillospiraceae bacterium]